MKNYYQALGFLVFTGTMLAGCGRTSEPTPTSPVLPPNESVATSTPKQRVVLGKKTIDENFDALCKTKFNQDLPNTAVPYQNMEAGFTVNLPHNDVWGSLEYRVLPYEKAETGIDFGPIFSADFEATCGVQRSYSLRPSPTRSVKEIEMHVADLGFTEKPVVKKYKNFEVAQYYDAGICTVTVYEIIGKKSNYQIMNTCAGPDYPMEKAIEPMLDSFTFINQ